MAQKQKIQFSRFRGKQIGLVRKRQGAWEEIQGEVVGYSVEGGKTIMFVSQDGLFLQCNMGWEPGLWMIAWVGEKPDHPKMDDLHENSKSRERVDPTSSDDFEDEGLSSFDLQVMAENIKKKRGPGRPPKANNGPTDHRFGMDERPDDLFDLTAGLSLGIGVEEDAYASFSLQMADVDLLDDCCL